jgi:transposase
LALVEKLRLSSVVSGDETGWRIGRQGVWLWVFATDELTVYVIAASRNVDVPEQVLGEDFGGILLTDGWQAYRSLPYKKAQCASHLLRRCDEEIEMERWWAPKVRQKKAFPKAIKRLLQRAIQLKHQQALMSPAAYDKRVARLEKRFRELIRRRFSWPGDIRFAKSLKRRKSQVLLFLRVPELPPTNNLAEQQIRPAVVLRKISAGNRTNAGAFVHQVLASVTQTAYRSGQRFVDFAPSLLTSPQPLIAPLRVLTDINSGGTLEPVRRNGSELGRESREGNLAPPPSEPGRIHRNSQCHRGPHRRTRCLTPRGQASGPSPP